MAMDVTTKSKAGVLYSSVYNGLNLLYPPLLYNERNAVSRKDGYWSFVRKGQEPDQACVYGEFDFFFFAKLLDRAHELFYDNTINNNDDTDKDKVSLITSQQQHPDWRDKVFVDLGSGTGRLVVGAAALHPGWKVCRGIEVLEGIHNTGSEIIKSCYRSDDWQQQSEEDDTMPTIILDETSFMMSQPTDTEWLEQLKSTLAGSSPVENAVDSNTAISESTQSIDVVKSDAGNKYFLSITDPLDPESRTEQPLQLAPMELTCGSFDDPYVYFGDADCVFCFCTAMPSETLTIIGKAIGRQCKPGTLVITTDYALPLVGVIDPLEDDDDPTVPLGRYELEIIDQVEGWCWVVGGESTAYIHRVVESTWMDNDARRKQRETVVATAPSVEDEAYNVVKALESGKLTDYKRFALNVYNDMAFHGLPESWFPKLDHGGT